MPDTQTNTSQHLQGTVERITFHNPDNGFCVLRVKVAGEKHLVTIVGNAAQISLGEHIECKGQWHHDKKYGQQFKAHHYLKAAPPTTLEGIKAYLGSGLIKGIGPQTADQLVAQFGETVFSVLENEPERLAGLSGIGKKRKAQIIASWTAQKVARDVMVFLQSHGIGVARALRIYKAYGDRTVTTITENPYRLAFDIQGIGFKTVDALAMRLGLPSDSIERAKAGIHHVLQELCDRGDCASPYLALVEAGVSLLGINSAIVEEALQAEIKANHLVLDPIDEVPCVFPTYLFNAETKAAKHLLRLRKGRAPWGEIDMGKALPWVEKTTGLELAQSQKEAIMTVLGHKLSIITGGPGVGKTTIINCILKMLQAKRLSVALCAPTGRAAKRLAETTGMSAKTIHRLLSFVPETRFFKYHQDHPLPIDVLIVDEASMIDVMLFSHLLNALSDHVGLICVGDVDQLPSVSPGAVLKDLIHSGQIATVKLTQIFRQAAYSSIVINAHRINQGEMPLAHTNTMDAQSDFYALYTQSPEETYHKLLELVTTRVPQHLGCHPIHDIQVLTPMNRGGLGTIALNMALQQALNGQAEPKVVRNGTTFAMGDKVIQTVNNYEKEVFNGDIGFISHINLANQTLKVTFDSHTVEYDLKNLEELSLAYAISIHKSQGSEFPVVLMPLSMQHYMLLARNLLYTGVTRGRKLVILVGEKKATGMAVHNNRESKRLTKLSQRLNQAFL